MEEKAFIPIYPTDTIQQEKWICTTHLLIFQPKLLEQSDGTKDYSLIIIITNIVNVWNSHATVNESIFLIVMKPIRQKNLDVWNRARMHSTEFIIL